MEKYCSKCKKQTTAIMHNLNGVVCWICGVNYNDWQYSVKKENKSMFNQDFIRDNGVIRKCSSNIAKMSVLEYLVYEKFFVKQTWESIKELKDIVKILINIFHQISIIFIILIAPISFPIIAYKRIIDAEKEVEYYKKYNNEVIRT